MCIKSSSLNRPAAHFPPAFTRADKVPFSACRSLAANEDVMGCVAAWARFLVVEGGGLCSGGGGSGEVEISDFNMEEGHEAGGEYTSLEIEGSAQVGSRGEVDANSAAFRRQKTIKIALVTGRADLKWTSDFILEYI